LEFSIRRIVLAKLTPESFNLFFGVGYTAETIKRYMAWLQYAAKFMGLAF